jgi:Spy/CpxP family protein refolding chaperone
MKQLSRILILAAAAAAILTLPALAQDGPPGGMAAALDRHAGGLLRCLRGADLTPGQKADIKAIFDAAGPTLKSDVQAVRDARQKLEADHAAGADKSVLGQDYINLRAAMKKLHDDGAATRDQVLAKLTPDQKTRVQACLDASRGLRHMHSEDQSD